MQKCAQKLIIFYLSLDPFVQLELILGTTQKVRNTVTMTTAHALQIWVFTATFAVKK